MNLKELLLGRNGGLTNEQLRNMTRRDSFSEFLPYVAYDPDTEMYVNIDDTTGFIWSCIPLVYAGEDTYRIAEGLFALGIPDGSELQFMLYADPYIDPYMERFAGLRVRTSGLIGATTDKTTEFLKKGARQGFDKLQGIPARDIRLIVCLKLPNSTKKATALDLKNNVAEILAGLHLFPENFPPEELIAMMSRLFNDNPANIVSYNKDEPIRKQIILSETPIKTEWDNLQIGKKHLRCLTVKRMAQFIDGLTLNYLTGDIWGVQSDGSQINMPFLFTVNVIFENLKAHLHGKCNFVLQQQAFGSLSPALKRKQEEYMWATGEIEKGTRFVRIMPIVWHIAPTAEQSKKTSARIKRIWESRGFVLQEDRGILNILFLSALPFGLYSTQGNVGFIDRDKICHPKAAAKCLPLQADTRGGGDPYLLFLGRKGQVVAIDFFDKRANNHNALVCASSGAGKSFLVNYIAFNYYASGAIIRLIDIGGSYKKLCDIVGGKFITFHKDSNISLNPFTFIRDINEEIGVLSSIVAQMVYSSTGKVPDETEMTILKNVIRTVYSDYGNEAGIDNIYDLLASPSKSSQEIMELECGENNQCVSGLMSQSANLAFNLRSFTTYGEFGKWFAGPSSLQIADDDFVVLELEELKQQTDLFNVITLQILNYVTLNLYLSGRERRRLIIFDEAWQFFKHSAMLQNVIEEGYRRARKYGGSFTTITQSLLDFEAFGSVGQVIQSNSAFKFMLESPDFEKAKAKKLIDYDDFTMSILKSVKSPRPRYSEIFMDTPVGTGVSRLLVDPYSYYLYTSDAGENAEIERLVGSGKKYSEVLSIMEENSKKENKI